MLRFLPLLFALALAGACAPAAAPPSSAPAAPSARELIAAGNLTIDVRTQQEWDSGHLPSARLVPIDDFEGRVEEIAGWLGGDRTKPVVVYCRSGNRSGRAKQILERAGFTHVVNGGAYQELR